MNEPTTTHAAPVNELVDLFTQRLSGVGGQVHRTFDSATCASELATIADGIPDRTIWISAELADRAPALMERLAASGFVLRQPLSAAEVRDQPLGLGIAEAAVAETGSVIMSEPAVAGRAVTLMTETLVIVCPLTELMPSLDEAAAVLRRIGNQGASYATFITGPSRTADIERQLTVGVQGPGVYHVILVDQLS